MSMKLNPPFILSGNGMVSVKIGGAMLSLGYSSKHAPPHAMEGAEGFRFHWEIKHLKWNAMGGGPSQRSVDNLMVGWMMFCKVLGCFALSAQAELDGKGEQEYSHLLPEQCKEWAVENHHYFAALMILLEQNPHILIIEGYKSPERN